MTDWRDLSSRIDQAAYRCVSDPVLINGRALRGMFQESWLQPRLGGLGTEITEPVILMRDADVADVVLGDIAQHAGIQYEIVGIEPDSTGSTALVLRQAHVVPDPAPDPDPEPDPDPPPAGEDEGDD